MARLFLISLLFLAGCVCGLDQDFKRRPDTSDHWNTNYLLDKNIETVTDTELAKHAEKLENHFWEYSQVDGVLWPAWRTDASFENPNRWINGGDSGIFTGIALAGWSFKYAKSRSQEDLEKLKRLIRGVYILTHATGKSGVICRNAAPYRAGEYFGYPLEFQSKIEAGFANHGPPLMDLIDGGLLGKYWYYTRGTKDQLTGLILGLAAVFKVTEPAGGSYGGLLFFEDQILRDHIRTITKAIYSHLQLHNWNIRNENGQNDTSADHVDDLIRVAVLALYRKTCHPDVQQSIDSMYEQEFKSFIEKTKILAYADQFNNYDSYYGHNLRICRALTVWMLDENEERRNQIRDYVDNNIWIYVKKHRNAWFNFVRNAMWPAEGREELADGIRGLNGLVFRPIRMWSSPLFGQEKKPSLVAVTLNCTEGYVVDTHLRKPEEYWIWQKEPWDVGEAFPLTGWDTNGYGDSAGIDFLTVYWFGRYHNLLD